MAPSPHLLPLNEEARLHALRTLALSEALKEPLVQRLVDLAAQVFNLPIAFLSVVEEASVDFAVTHGVSPLLGEAREGTLCSLPVREGGTFIIPDINDARAGEASVHRVTADKLGLVFYAGSPLLVEGQLAIGALCVSDTDRRHFSDLEQQALETLAALVSSAVQLRQALGQQAGGQQRWDALQAVIEQEISSLEALLRYLTSRHGGSLPPTPLLLGVVRQRLASITTLLLDIHQAA